MGAKGKNEALNTLEQWRKGGRLQLQRSDVMLTYLLRIARRRSADIQHRWRIPIQGGPNERTEEEIGKDLSRLAAKLDSQTILVTHGPARGILDAGHGSKSLAEFLEHYPVYAHIYGQVHAAFGRRGNRFNVASGTEGRLMTIDLETLDHTVLKQEPRSVR